MRTLVVLRGHARSGRSSFIRNAGLQAWHVDQLAVEALHGNAVSDLSGEPCRDRQNANAHRDALMQILRGKFARGAFVLFEPADTGAPAGRRTQSIRDRLIEQVVGEARLWRYRIIILDFCEASPLSGIAGPCIPEQSALMKGPDASAIFKSARVSPYKSCLHASMLADSHWP